jgi:5-methylcytosine-specific restriction protein B
LARYCGNKNSTSILDVAEYWRDECLLGHKSVFGDTNIWTLEYTDELVTHFVKNLDTGDGDFNEKLKQQLEHASDNAKQLAAEMMWVMLLCPSNIGSNKKRENINTILGWANRELGSNRKYLSDEVLNGIGSSGPGYNQFKWKELVYCINFTKAFLILTDNDKQKIITNGNDCAGFLESIDENETRQFRHMLLFLLFPDNHERIFGRRDRIAIAKSFSGKSKAHINALKARELDLLLLQLRKEQEEIYGGMDLDWYVSPLDEKWSREGVEVSEALTETNILDAISEIDRRGIAPGEKSSTYDLIFQAKRYPPKLVYALANKYANGMELDRSTFHGGEGTTCFKTLSKHGFHIERKGFVFELLKKFIQQADGGNDLKTSSYPNSYCGLKIKVSFGQGGFAKVPWISFLGHGQTTSNGIYPGYLYYKSIGVLLLTYGISDTNAPDKLWDGLESSEKITGFLMSKYEHTPERYGESYVNSAYKLPIDFPSQQITSDLDVLIHEYYECIGDNPNVGIKPVIDPSQIVILPKSIMDPKAIAISFATALKASNVYFGANHNDRVSAFVSSLMTKPLVILTGLSGSGKTQIAIRFGEWLGKDRMLVAPVRPDWTGAEALFGYEDALKPVNNANAAWAVPETLQFLLKAAADSNYPYLLVLDEMNLAHVERYFADVLSGMESNQPCLPNLERDSDGFWRLKQNEPDKITLPNNVFIVGTVNVDETTYMFSPKVLDRANTFEFRVTAADLADSYIKPIECESGEVGLIRGFLEIGRDSGWQAVNYFDGVEGLSKKMRQIHNILSKHGFEFGHRVFYESQRFASIYSATGEASTAKILDLIIMQKLLPRLHGSRRRLEDLIRTFAEFCFYDATVAVADNLASTFEPDNYETIEAKLPNSFNKLKRMLRSLRANQFTSFTE